VAQIAFLEEQLNSLAIGGKFKVLTLAVDVRECNEYSKAKSVTEFLTEITRCAKVSKQH
jgi:hypothetical protein